MGGPIEIGQLIIHKIVSGLLFELQCVPTPEDGFYDRGNSKCGPWFWHADSVDVKTLVEAYPHMGR